MHAGVREWVVTGADPLDADVMLLRHRKDPELVVSASVAEVRRSHIEHMVRQTQTFEELTDVIEKCGYIEWDPRNEPKKVASPDELADAITVVRGGGPPARRALTRIPTTYGLKKRIVELGIEMLAGPPVSERNVLAEVPVPASGRDAQANRRGLKVLPYARSVLFP